MESKTNYVVVGIFVIALCFALIAVIFWLSAMKHDRFYQTYLVYVHEGVSGLTVQSPVRYNGVPVGYVDDIGLDVNNPQLVRLTLRLQEGTPVTTSTVASLDAQGVTGVVNVELKAETVDAPLLKALPGQKYPVIPAKPSLLMQLSEVLPEVTKNMQMVGESIGKLLNKRNRQAIGKSLQNMAAFTQSLKENTKNLNASMTALQETLNNTAKASKTFPDVVKQLNGSLVEIQGATKNLSQASISVNKVLQQGQVSIANFSNQVMPQAQQALLNFNDTLSNLKGITDELQQNPAMLIRGKQPPAPGPGER